MNYFVKDEEGNFRKFTTKEELVDWLMEENEWNGTSNFDIYTSTAPSHVHIEIKKEVKLNGLE